MNEIWQGPTRGMNPYKEKFAVDTERRTLADAVRGAFTPELLSFMAEKPIIFPLANPDPEIGYEEAKAARPDAISNVESYHIQLAWGGFRGGMR